MKIWKEPLVQFLVLGGILFAAYTVFGPKADEPVERIVINAPVIESLEQSFEAVWKRPPSDDERTGLVEDYLAEEVLYREAQKLGLDRDDVVIRRRMRQKVEFLLQDSLSRVVPDEAALRAFFETQSERYQAPDRISFRQIFLGENRSAEDTAHWQALVVSLNGASPPDPLTLGLGSLLPPAMASAADQEIDRSFGTGFANELAALPVGRWTGPVESTFGWHLVLVDEFRKAGAPEFDSVRAEVERDYAYQRDIDASKALIKRQKQGYDIQIGEVTQ